MATDIRHGRHSLAEALRMSEIGGDSGGPPFEWDIALDVGDVSGAMGLCEDWEGEEIAPSTEPGSGTRSGLATSCSSS